jgi:exonuclease SbcC
MDEKNFQNCAYIRQGDVDALINAKPADRQKMIDDLLRLGKLEDYRQRSHDSKKAVQRILNYEQDNQKKVKEKIEDLRSKNLFGELNRCKEIQNKHDDALRKKRDEKEGFVTEFARLEAKLKEIKAAENDIKALKQNILELERKHDEEAEEKDKTIRLITDAEKKIGEKEKAFKIIVSELEQLGRSIESGDGKGIDDLLIQMREEEKKASREKYELSSKLELIAADKKNKETNAAEKEKDQASLEKTLSDLEKNLLVQTKVIDDANTAVEAGYAKAENDKKAFLDIFDDVIEQLNSEVKVADADEKIIFDTICKDCKDIAFLASVVKAAELPIPSEEELWKTTVSDIEFLC